MGDYLQKTNVVRLDSSGNGIVVLRPDVGQIWAPKWVRVSTVSQTPPIGYCAVYHGPVQPAIAANFTPASSFFVDDTYLANSDSSSIISGTVVQYGEAITAVFTGGNPLDTAIFSVYGATHTLPPSIGEMPSVPGTHFSGRGIVKIDTLANVSGGVITPGNSINIMQGLTAQMRNYDSFRVAALVDTSGAAAYNAVRGNFRWSDPTGQIAREDFEFWASTASPGANQEPVLQGAATWYYADKIHGSFLNFSLSNGGTTNITINNVVVEGLSNTMEQPFQVMSPYDDTLYWNPAVALPAGNLYYIIPLPSWYGRAYLHVEDTAAALIQATLSWGSGFAGLFLMNGAGAANFNLEFVNNRRATFLLLNRPAGAGTARVFLHTQRERL